jgi:hypothetical protein
LRRMAMLAGEEEDEEGGSDVEARDSEADSEDDALAAVLDNARKLSGSRRQPKQRFTGEEEQESSDGDDDDQAENATYADFFDAPQDGRYRDADGRILFALQAALHCRCSGLPWLMRLFKLQHTWNRALSAQFC